MLSELKRQRGFSLLEAIVALAVFSAVGVVLLSWINRSISIVAEIDRLTAEAKAEELAVVELMQENLFEKTTGTIELPDNYRVLWQADPVSNRQKNLTLTGGGSGRHNIQLFVIKAQIIINNLEDTNNFSNERRPTTFKLTRLMVNE